MRPSESFLAQRLGFRDDRICGMRHRTKNRGEQATFRSKMVLLLEIPARRCQA